MSFEYTNANQAADAIIQATNVWIDADDHLVEEVLKGSASHLGEVEFALEQKIRSNSQLQSQYGLTDLHSFNLQQKTCLNKIVSSTFWWSEKQDLLELANTGQCTYSANPFEYVVEGFADCFDLSEITQNPTVLLPVLYAVGGLGVGLFLPDLLLLQGLETIKATVTNFDRAIVVFDILGAIGVSASLLNEASLVVKNPTPEAKAKFFKEIIPSLFLFSFCTIFGATTGSPILRRALLKDTKLFPQLPLSRLIHIKTGLF